MSTPYSIDIYRTDDAIFIHDKPGGWKRAILGLLLSLFPVYFAIACILALFFVPQQQVAVQQQVAQQQHSLGEVVGIAVVFLLLVPVFGFMLFSFASVFLFSLWRIGGHETILIDRDSIRNDWWCFWGRRSRILPRPEKIQTDAIPGFWITGGHSGVKMHIGKRRRWFGTRKIYMYLPSYSERKWLFDEMARFQQEVAVTEPVNETRPIQKGMSIDHDYGKNLLETGEYRGKKLVRVIPGNESATTEETTDHLPLGVLQMRCVACHRIISHDHVVTDLLLAKCPRCETVFEPSELERTDFSRHSRIRVRRDADSLEIVQKPQRTGMPLCILILFLLIDAGCIALYLYLQRLFPGEDPLTLLRAEENPEIPLGERVVLLLAMLHVVFLFLPLWAFFDKRVIRIDRETLRISGSWLWLFRWKRTVARVQVKRANNHIWQSMFRQAKLSYGNTSVYIGSSTEEDVDSACAEINHFLYTVPPRPMEHVTYPPPQPAFLGGVDSGSPEVRLHCPDCGTRYAASSLDFPQQTAHCPNC